MQVHDPNCQAVRRFIRWLITALSNVLSLQSEESQSGSNTTTCKSKSATARKVFHFVCETVTMDVCQKINATFAATTRKATTIFMCFNDLARFVSFKALWMRWKPRFAAQIGQNLLNTALERTMRSWFSCPSEAVFGVRLL